jgi:phosphotransferase system HPr-like phosphotransfer protein/ferredoxin
MSDPKKRVEATVKTVDDRKLVLYVDGKWFVDRGTKHQTVLDSLRACYEVVDEYNLSEETVQLVQDALETCPFDAIVTHVPCESAKSEMRYSYSASLNMLHKLRSLVDIPLIAYTGARSSEVLITIGCYAHKIINKTENTEEDAQAIIHWLETTWEYLKDNEPSPPPELHQVEGWTFVDAIVNLKDGIDAIAASGIVRKSSLYEGETTFILNASDKSPEIIDSKRILMIVMYSITKGTPIRISIEGTDSEARQLVLQLYAGITSHYACDMWSNQPQL